MHSDPSQKDPFPDPEEFLSDLTRSALRARKAGYVPKERAGSASGAKPRLFLNLGINPYGCAPEVLQHKDNLPDRALHMYFEECFTDLYRLIAERHSSDPGSVVISRGLDHMLMMLTLAFLSPGETVLTLNPTFFLFEEYSRLRGADVIGLDLHEADGFDWTEGTFGDYRRVLRERSPKLFFIANPNNPTGRLIPLHVLDEIVAEARDSGTVVVVDEAYGEFADGPRAVLSASALQGKYANLIVLRTLSKGIGLADLRVGYALAHPRWVPALNMHRAYFPFSLEAYSLAKFALQPRVALPFLRKTRQELESVKRALYARLDAMPRASYIHTSSNILMIRHLSLDAAELMEKLASRGVLVASVPGTGDAARNYVRVTIGTAQDMSDFADALQHF